MRDRLKMLIAEANVEWLNKTYDHETDKTLAEYTTDHLLANGVIVCDTLAVEMKNRPLITQCLGRPLYEIIELVQAKDDGRIIVPPCKVGDTVYIIDEAGDGECSEDYVLDVTVSQFIITEDGIGVKLKTPIGLRIGCWMVVGKNVFLTREEAEEALVKRKGGAE